MKKKVLALLAALGVSVTLLPMFAAFEAHVINVTATIENALSVPADPILFGTVFPQEHLFKTLGVRLSQSFLDEDRVDDVEYIIRQKPKCGITAQGGQVLVGPTATGHVKFDATDHLIIDCGEPPRELAQGETWGVLPLLCPYLSKHEDSQDGTETNNDGSLAAFHEPWTIVGHQIVWNDVHGRLAKSAGDMDDSWIIDLAVPCFGGFCAQDWARFVAGINPNADPDDYTQPIANEHKVFGCDLWIEVTGVSLCDPGEHTVVSDTTNTVQSGGNAVAVSPIHPAWTASIPVATWIWSENPVSSQTDQTETFVKQFNVTGTVTGTPTLAIASDNTYSVVINGTPVCSSSTADNFTLATQDVCNVTNLVGGTNTIEITVKNNGTGNSSNPAGLLYKLTYTTVCTEQ